jgi:hypothetical protein
VLALLPFLLLPPPLLLAAGVLLSAAAIIVERAVRGGWLVEIEERYVATAHSVPRQGPRRGVPARSTVV